MTKRDEKLTLPQIREAINDRIKQLEYELNRMRPWEETANHITLELFRLVLDLASYIEKKDKSEEKKDKSDQCPGFYYITAADARGDAATMQAEHDTWHTSRHIKRK